MKKDMGGLRHAMPITYWTFVIGSLALAGIFPLAGFWSKDEILVSGGHNGYTAFLIIGLIGAAMTAAYMARCVWLTFWGEPRGAAAHHHPHESPKAITGVLLVLTGLSITAGLLNAPGIELFTKWTDNTIVLDAMEQAGVHHADFNVLLAVGSVLVASAALVAAWLYYERSALPGLHGLTERNRAAHAGYTLLERKYYLDVLWTDVVVGSIKGPIARAASWLDRRVLDGAVNGTGVGARIAGRLVYKYIDQGLVDGVVNGSGAASESSGQVLRHIQTGKVQQYAALLFAAATVLAGIFVVFI
jgi:NADH-quinone oxidoreductase subunit L